MNGAPRHPSLTRRRFVVAGLAATGGVVLAGCSSGSSTDAYGDAGGTPDSTGILRFHERTSAPTTLDPAAAAFWNSLAYDVLIYRAPDGTFQPQLAESWQYVGSGNTTFEMVLRSGVTFTDGTPLTADAIRANIDYRKDPAVGSQSARYAAVISEVEVVDDLTVRIHLSEPNPLLPVLFGQGQGGPGILISPAALQEPSVLATSTYGVSRYLLVEDETVLGDHYTYAANPDYWNPDDVHWDRVVVHYMPEESAALSALQTSQLDAAWASFAIIGAGREAGLSVTGPGRPIVFGLSLTDRDGAVAPALADVRVRQALNYAVDRAKIAAAIVGDSGAPVDQLAAPGGIGWNEEGFYPFDQDRARDLLREAGYADGFTMPIRIPRSEQHTRIAQAIADALSDVGVELEINAVPSNQFDAADAATNSEYGAIYLGWGVDYPVRMAASFWLQDATNNTFGSVDETLQTLQQQALVADEESRQDLDRQIIARVSELAWFLPVLVQGESVLFNDELVEIPWVDFMSAPTVSELRPAS